MRHPPKAPKAAQLKAALVSVQTFASDEWMTRGPLHRLAGLPDRTFRLCVEHLVRMGEPIATNHTRGYRYVAGSPDHLLAAAVELKAKANALLRRARALEDCAARTVAANRGQQQLMLEPSQLFTATSA